MTVGSMQALIFSLALAYAGIAGALVDAEAEWDSATVSSSFEGRAIVVSAKRADGKLGSLLVAIDGTQISVPAAQFSDLDFPDLKTLQIRSPDVKGPGRPEMYVAMEFHKANASGVLGAPLSIVRFYFLGNKYHARHVQVGKRQ